jgi:two-component system sensor histidine kinase BaeS
MTEAAGVARVRILVVEDEEAIRRVIVGYLEREGFEVSEAADGLAALDSARAGQPDLVVLDLMLPGLATLVSVSVGVVAALAVAAAGALLVAGRLSRPVAEVAEAAGRLAGGDFSARVQPPGMGSELAGLADSINALADRLEEAEATRIRLLADLAHQLRTPVAAIEATVEGVIDGVLPLDDRARETLGHQSRRLDRLVEDLLAVSRAEERAFTVRLGAVDLVGLAVECAASARPRSERKGVALTPPDQQALWVRADRGRLAEVVDQLLDNALRHTPSGGSVRIVAQAAAGGCELSVVDSGSGFPADRAELLFDRFYRAVDQPSGAAGSA